MKRPIELSNTSPVKIHPQDVADVLRDAIVISIPLTTCEYDFIHQTLSRGESFEEADFGAKLYSRDYLSSELGLGCHIELLNSGAAHSMPVLFVELLEYDSYSDEWSPCAMHRCLMVEDDRVEFDHCGRKLVFRLDKRG